MPRLLLISLILFAQDPPALTVAHEVNSRTIPPYEVFEITFTHENAYADPFFDVAIDVMFVSPRGRKLTVGGFHYGSAEKPKIVKHGQGRVTYTFTKQNLWKARFAPDEIGEWSWSYVFTDREKKQATGRGTFACVAGRKKNPGFVRPNPKNPFRWIFDDGRPFHPVGLQDGVFDNDGVGSVLASAALEGPFRMDRKGRPEPPPGAMFKPGPSHNPFNYDVYFRRYGRCGFNLLRFSQKNFSLDLYRDLDHWGVQESIMVDEFLRCARKYGFRVMYGLFGYQPVKDVEKVKRFIKYSVDRWGAYADFWELLNEQHVEDKWYAETVPYLRSLDPYRHPITTSWERPHLEGIEINAPHWYENEDELRSDAITAARAKEWKKHGKPVIVGEQGNHVDRAKAPPGVGGVWDAGSARRMRLRLWTAFFSEISFVFWNTSYAKDGHNMNIWLGPKEREYVAALQRFSARLDADVAPCPVATSATNVRAYGLASKKIAAVYVCHVGDRKVMATDLEITIDVPVDGTAYWISPETGAILDTKVTKAGRSSLKVPDFGVDLALVITPDRIEDGPDDDGDGVPDEKDAFPLDPEEWEDKDGDLIGDVLDADDDADGKPDVEAKSDIDGDGVPQSGSVPWDAFPFDPKEWRDTDGDAVGDNADPDDDGDGWSDEVERKAGTDPLDALRFP